MSSPNHAALDIDLDQVTRWCLCLKLTIHTHGKASTDGDGHIGLLNGLVHGSAVVVVANAERICLWDHASTVHSCEHRAIQHASQLLEGFARVCANHTAAGDDHTLGTCANPLGSGLDFFIISRGWST